MSEDRKKPLMIVDLDGVLVEDPSKVARYITWKMQEETPVKKIRPLAQSFLNRIFNTVKKLRILNPGKNMSAARLRFIGGLIRNHSEFVARNMIDQDKDFLSIDEANSILEEVAENIGVSENIRNLVNAAVREGIEVRLLTAQPQKIAEVFGRKLGLQEEQCYGTEFRFDEKTRKLTGEVGRIMEPKEKAKVLKELIGKGYDPHIIIDDSYAAMGPMVEVAIEHLKSKYPNEKRLKIIKVGSIGFVPKGYEKNAFVSEITKNTKIGSVDVAKKILGGIERVEGPREVRRMHMG